MDINNNKMNRREAIKRVGMGMAGAALALSGVGTLAACDRNSEKRERRLVFYFTATGNCLYVARQLTASPLSIPQVMKTIGTQSQWEADEIGLVLPTYEGAPPEMVKRFLLKARLKARYLFAVITYGVNHTSVVDEFQKVAQRGGNRFDYIATMTMVDNYLPGFDMDEQQSQDHDEPGQLARISADLAAHKRWIEPVTDADRQMRAWALANLGPLLPVKCENLFTVTGLCIGCGICTRVCPRGNYQVGDGGHATCAGDCEYCLACAQNCPQHAIVLARDKNPKARYRHPHITLADIVRANNQMKL